MHYKALIKGDYINAAELVGKTPTVTIDRVEVVRMEQEDGRAREDRANQRFGALEAGAKRLESRMSDLESDVHSAKSASGHSLETAASASKDLIAVSAAQKQLAETVAELKKQLALGGGSGGSSAPEEIGGIKLMARVLDGVDGKGLRGVAEDFRKQVGTGVVALIGVTEGKAAVTVAVTSDLTDRVNAAALARAAVIAMGGQGAGGKPDFAQGGAPDGSKAEDGLTAVREALKA
jgi:alanyl-tRNA synthetase